MWQVCIGPVLEWRDEGRLALLVSPIGAFWERAEASRGYTRSRRRKVELMATLSVSMTPRPLTAMASKLGLR